MEAAFSLETFRFTKASLDFNIPSDAKLNIEFKPQGVFNSEKSSYKLEFDVIITCKETTTNVVMVSCLAYFSFNDTISIDEIPEYFYPNSIAIIFPYIRAFISTLSLQANMNPILLPTINLMGLTDELKSKTREEN